MDQSYQRLSKPALFQRLKESTNLARLQRARARAAKSGGEPAGAGASAAALTASSSSSAGPSAASAGGRARGAQARGHLDEAEEEAYYDCREEDEGGMMELEPSTPGGVAAGAGHGRGLRSHRSATAAAAHAAVPGGGKLSPAEAAAAAAAAAKGDGGKKGSGGGGGGGHGKKAGPGPGGLNERDPIFGTPLSAHTFRFTRPNGSGVLYDVESLVDYVLHTGQFIEPETRLPLTDADLRHLDALARGAGLGRPSVWEARHSARQGQAYAEMRFRRDGLLGLERCAGELVAEMLALVEAEGEEGDEGEEEEETWKERAELRLVVTLFPLLTDLYQQMHAADEEWARQCLAHFSEYLRGPPNRRTRDPHGFLRVVLGFFRDLRAGQGHF